MSKTMEQDRAADALKRINEIKDNTSLHEKYVSTAAALPATIVANGLGQAAATLIASGNDAQIKLYKHLQSWLCHSDREVPYATKDGKRVTLMEAIIQNDRETYMHAQAEAIAYLQWIKKFANAFLKVKGGEQS